MQKLVRVCDECGAAPARLLKVRIGSRVYETDRCEECQRALHLRPAKKGKPTP